LVVCTLVAACADDADDEDTGGGDGDASGDSCPDLEGSWTIKEHCGANLIGMTVTVAQDGCDLVVHDMGDYRGSVKANGDFALTGDSANATPVMCTGTATATKIQETCASTCDVVLEKK
jgi:hypothetical protein